jgi:hypothetical protein
VADEKAVADHPAAVVVREFTAQRHAPEPTYPLTEMEFEILLRGEQAPAEESLRAAAWGILATVAAGVVGVLCTVSLNQIASNGTASTLLFWGLVAFGLLATAMIGMTTIRLRKITRDPVCRFLTEKIKGVFLAR